MSGHTPGPWGAETYHGCKKIGPIVGAREVDEVVCTAGLWDETEDAANARLIAAAPDLLEAAKALLDHMGYVNTHGEWTIRPDHPLSVLRTAIQKAEAAS